MAYTDIITRLKRGERITFKRGDDSREYHYNRSGYHATFAFGGEVTGWEYLPTDEDMRKALSKYQEENWGVLNG